MNKVSIKSLKKDKKKGFTLVELIIVIAIIAILAAMAIPKFGQVRTDAKISNDIAAAKNIQSTVSMLVGNGTIPENTSTITLEDTDANGKLITDRIDGAKKPKAKDGNFVVSISNNGDVSVKSSVASGVILAPANETTAGEYKKAIDKADSASN